MVLEETRKEYKEHCRYMYNVYYQSKTSRYTYIRVYIILCRYFLIKILSVSKGEVATFFLTLS